jgi:GNAT superfamily N-acetyltransferase
MTPERISGLVGRWARCYTRNLPAPVAERRVDEIDADLHDHIAYERTHGSADWRIALSIVSRMVRGLAADASWRGHHLRAVSAHSSTRDTTMKTYRAVHRSTLAIALAAALFLLAHVVGTLVTDEIAWGPEDFTFAGVTFAGMGLANETAARKADTLVYKIALAVAVAAAVFLVWSALAVGIIGGTGDPADLMYAGVLAVGVAGAVLARFRPRGMARALLATALAQAVVAGIALIAGKHEAPITSVAEILGINGLFVALFAGSAWLFGRAARASSGGSRAEAWRR